MIEFFSSIADAVGLVGVLLLLIAFYFLNTNKFSPMSMCYQVFNLLGALFILYSLIFHWNLSSFTIEVAWVMISLIGIYRAVQS
ncbi:MAG: hypothetical protein EPO11_04680 [Gammaproteobacteria bacterium]|nr:MAG: hypothetical protein EPO11_04680 [Gammaproteobacteria bacterium]